MKRSLELAGGAGMKQVGTTALDDQMGDSPGQSPLFASERNLMRYLEARDEVLINDDADHQHDVDG